MTGRSLLMPASGSAPAAYPRPSARPAWRVRSDEVLRWAGQSLQRYRWTILVYLATRLVLLIVAVTLARVEHISLLAELGRWDGTWYGQVASSGYPRHASPFPTTLGFFPLYPIVIWLVVHLPGPPNSVVLAGTLVSMIGGLVATILVERLASGWWGEAGGRRAALLFCVFPGSVVFSMAYAEGILLPLATGCLLALQQRRWVLAGVLAGFATAVQPDAVALVVVCALRAGLEIRRQGWRNHEARRSVLAPVLSTVGIGVFAVFLWLHTGTPFATLEAQRNGWGEKVDPLALVHQGRRAVREISRANIDHLHIPFTPVAAVIGAVVLVIGLVLLFRSPKKVSSEAMIWTLCIAALAFVSENVAPNPRILITAFPAILVFAYYCRRRQYVWLIGVVCLLLVLTSALTYGGRTLTP
jgi:hypothetical protein